MNLRAQVLILCACLFSTHALSQDKLRFVSIEGLIDQEISAHLAKRIFAHAGIDIDIEPMPAARAKFEVLHGRRDGELSRIFSFGVENPELLRVSTPYYEVETKVYALKSKQIKISRIEDIEQYEIAIVRGVQTTKDLTEGMDHIHDFTNLEQAIRFVERGRADIFITSGTAAMFKLDDMKYGHIEPVYDVHTLPLYFYLVSDHHDLVEQIDSSIRELIADGRLETYIEQLEEKYLPGN